LHVLVLLIKKWFDDPIVGFEASRGPQNVHGFGEAEVLSFWMRLKIIHRGLCALIDTCIHDFGNVLFNLHMELFKL
jgi:hypothetical protein